MLHRHRVPTIFSIYMLDVICCALGCVVLLWQVAHQEADEITAQVTQFKQAADAIRAKFASAQEAYLTATAEVNEMRTLIALLNAKEVKAALALAATEKEREDARKTATSRQEEIEKARKALTLSEDQLKRLNDELAKLLASNKKTGADLTGQMKLNADLLARMALAEKRIAALNKDIASKSTDVDVTSKKLQEQTILLKLSEENARKLQKLLDAVRDENKDWTAKLKLNELLLAKRDKELDQFRADYKDLIAARDKLGKDAKSRAKDLTDANDRITALILERDIWKEKSLASAKDLIRERKTFKEKSTASKDLVTERDLWKQKSIASAKELEIASAALGVLSDEKVRLKRRISELQSEADQRFAGVTLSGESIIFMIDVSGSMLLKDAKTPDPDKWPFLCETLMQLMKSLTSMKRFQIILFSDKTEYLFGNKDYWMKYEGTQTAVTTRDKLKKYEVGGNTNMHDAFEEAFRYRKIGLDTIYLFSDGLPNVGEGLPGNLRTPTEAELSYHLGKHVRDKLRTDWNRPIAGRDQVRINAIGFFFESPDVGAFLWSLAREHKGNFVGVR